MNNIESRNLKAIYFVGSLLIAAVVICTNPSSTSAASVHQANGIKIGEVTQTQAII